MVFPPRLKKRAQFLKVARQGKKNVFPGLVAQAQPAAEADAGSADAFRVGFTVTKKVGNSVVRNRTRRRLREAMRLVACERKETSPLKPSLPPGQLVLIGRASTRHRPFEALKQDVRQAVAGLEKAAPSPKGGAGNTGG
ncbi:ribonuclease P protein component [Oecophyllibacter saccharovorans]|uniref:Ribonuclease P protein component n=1 Tax=Oecophyllibacter saccharovorans TaxID=2558360 RepID=A0A506UQ27_9PROT|nr:ribonuclease P protein component [Oecophyllibacter saccharovorans]TPW35447.1 ribonuclease P protein component [Oecophyllibacter saccharovorans]